MYSKLRKSGANLKKKVSEFNREKIVQYLK